MLFPIGNFTQSLKFFGKNEQFIYDLPARLQKCIKSEAYGDAVRFYTGAMPILKVCISPLG